jgi:hypothetical protein
MSLYYPGYQQAREAIQSMDEQELLQTIDSLMGRNNLLENYTLEELRSEALVQCREDFTDKNSTEYEMINFYTNLHKAMKASHRA